MTELEAKVKAVNKANAYANELLPRLLEVYGPLLGQKIYKADNVTLLKKVADAVEALNLPNDHTMRVYRDASKYSLRYLIYVYSHGDTFNAYHEAIASVNAYHEAIAPVGMTEDGILKELYSTVQPFRTDYSVKTVEALRTNYKELKQEADEALSALYPFGERD